MALRDKLKRIYAKIWVLVSRIRLRLKPDHAWSRLQLAHAEVQQGAWQSAADLSLQVLTKEPGNARAYQILSLAYGGQGDRSKAFSAIATAIQLDPKVCWFYQDLGKLYLADDEYELAILEFRKAIALDSNNSWLQFNLGEGLVKQGNWKAAIGPLHRTIQLNPVFPWAYFYVAEAHLNLGEIEAAISYYRKAMVVGPDIEYFHEALAYAKNLQDQDDRIKLFCQNAQLEDASRKDISKDHNSNRKPRVLLITPYPPYPPKLGGHSRMFYEMKALNAKTDLVVMSLGFSKLDFPLEQDLARFSQMAIVVAPGDYPAGSAAYPKAIHRYSSQRMNQLLTLLNSANFDWVMMDFIYTAQYRQFFPNSFAILNEHNVESHLLKRQLEVTLEARRSPSYVQLDLPFLPQSEKPPLEFKSTQTQLDSELERRRSEANHLETYENELWPQFSLLTVVSELDQKIVQQRSPSTDAIVVNNGINTKTVKLFEDNPVPRILFMGTLNYYPNIDGVTYFIKEILPLVWKQNPTILCWVAGAGAPQQIYDIAQDSRIKVISDPEHMEDVAEQCCCTVVPLRIGGGTRIKILHSMAMGLPVISSSLGCEGLDLIDNEHLLIRDEPSDFADAIVQIIKDQPLRQRLRLQGRELVERDYDWENIFDTSIENLLTRWRTPTS